MSAPGEVDLGRNERRQEGRLKVTGGATYAADVSMPDMLWARFVTSNVSHGRVADIDTAAAVAVPGVHAVLTGADVRGARFGRLVADYPVLAWDRVRFMGERVAAVAAETREAAEEAVRLVEVDYEELPVLLDPEQAMAEGAPVLHESAGDYTVLMGSRAPMPHPNVQGQLVVRKGPADGEADLEAAMAGSHRVFEHRFVTPRQHQGHIEPHACLVWIDDDDIVHVVTTNKAPFALRAQMAACTGLAPDRIVVDAAFIGGDFGGKGFSVDEFPCYYLARATGRPVKAVMTYAEELEGVNPRHPAVVHLRTGVDAEGRFLAHESRIVFDGGAYVAAKPVPTLVPAGAIASLSAYQVPVTRLEITAVYTNTVPSGHMRSPGEVQALFAGESHVDMIAAELGIDPLELRLRNALRAGDTGPANERFPHPCAVEVLEALRAETRWGEEALPPHRGRGLAVWQRHVGTGRSSALLRLAADGGVEVRTAVVDQGGGAHTALRRVAATTLGIAEDDVVVTRGTTADMPFDTGVGASRVTHVAGEAVRRGAEALKTRLEQLAAETVGDGSSWELAEGVFTSASSHGPVVPFREMTAQLLAGDPVEVEGAYDAGHGDEFVDYSFAAVMVEVDVDVETGRAHVRDAVLAADVGTIINPVAHQGQIDGGFVYGLGGALMEELVVEDGQVMTVSFGDYKLPTSMDVPPLRTVLVRAPVGPGPFGAKAVGELSNGGVAPAIANAVAAATGVRLTRLPITAEAIYDAMRRPQ